MPIPSFRTLLLLFSTLTLTACMSTPTPDYRVRLMPSPDGSGLVALPPECQSWYEKGLGNPIDNQQHPTFGCASARNLAAQVDRPEDLIEGKKLGSPDPVAASAAVARYRAGKTLPLMDPGSEVPTPPVRVEDSRVGGGAIK